MPEKVIANVEWKCTTCGQMWADKSEVRPCKNPACGKDCCLGCGAMVSVKSNRLGEDTATCLADFWCHAENCEAEFLNLLNGLIDNTRILRIIRRQYRKDNKQEQDESGPAGIDAENQE